MSDEGRRRVQAYIENMQLEQTHAYLQRGRRFAGLTVEELDSSWAMAFKVWADARPSRSAFDRTTLDDLGAEICLRGQRPPSHLVKAHLAALAAAQSERLKDAALLFRFQAALEAQLCHFEEGSAKKPRN
jgi:hypothetical protein